MTIPELCVRRPVFTTMMMGLLIVLGVFSFLRLGVDLNPNVDFPFVTVRTFLPGASSEEVESEVTKRIEEAVNTVSGIDELNSTSTEGLSLVTVRFVLEKDGNIAAQEVRDKIAQVTRLLPAGTDPPLVVKIDPTAMPVLSVVVSGSRDMVALTEFTRKRVKESLETVNGVGQVDLVGARERAVNVKVTRERLERFGLSILQVKNAIARENLETPIGRVTQAGIEWGLRALARFAAVPDFERLVVAWSGGAPVYLADVAEIENGFEEPRTLSRLDGRPSVTLVVKKQAGTNTVRVVDAVNDRLAEIRRALPPDVALEVVGDMSRFIRASIREVELHITLGALFASLVVFLFLGNVRATIIAALAIPISIVSSFTLMQYMGFTLNNITLLALALAVGIVIDDTIVVVENIFRTMETRKLGAAEAAIEGTAEIGLAVMATTFSLMVIFLPVAFMSGMVGRFFQSYGLTVAFAIGVSLFVSFTMAPMLCSVLFRGRGGRAEGASRELSFNVWLDRAYGRLVAWSLDNRLVVVVTAALTFALSVPLFGFIGKDFMPADDTSEFNVNITTPPGWSLERVDAAFQWVEEGLRKVRGVKSTLTTIGSADSGDVTSGTILVRVEDIKARDYPMTDSMNEARALLRRRPELRTGVSEAGSMGFGGGRQAKLQLGVSGPDLATLGRAATRLKDELAKIPGYIDLDTSLEEPKPELRVRLDRAKMAEAGFQAGDVVSALRTMVGGEVVSRYKEADEQYHVILRFEPSGRDSQYAVEAVRLRNAAGRLVPLSFFAAVETAEGPSRIERINRERQIKVMADLDDRVKPLSEALADCERIFPTLGLPPEYRTTVLGRARILGETLQAFLMAFVLSVILMYIVLASQFESFIHPVTILLTLPLTLPFALLSILLTREPLNIYSIFGLFMLFGIVKKNAILQIDYTNTLRERGVALREAIIEANVTRLRPILMTTLTLIAGMIPIALGRGPGAAARASMAKVIVGGQALCLLLTLLVVPVAYDLFERASRRLLGKKDEDTGPSA